MGEGVTPPPRCGETAAHRQLKRLAVFWAQTHDYSACAVEVSLARCRYRADVAAFRLTSDGLACSAIFECKQAKPDLQRDNCCAATARQRLETVQKRRQVIERHLRVHYPALRRGDSLFAEFDSHDFAAIGHRNYARVVRELTALQNQLADGAKFEKLARYRCANLFYLVLPNELLRSAEIPLGWGVLVESDGSLSLAQKPAWHETRLEDQVRFLHRIALAGTSRLNKTLEITFDEMLAAKRRALT